MTTRLSEGSEGSEGLPSNQSELREEALEVGSLDQTPASLASVVAETLKCMRLIGRPEETFGGNPTTERGQISGD